jgi:hypothetical protein
MKTPARSIASSHHRRTLLNERGEFVDEICSAIALAARLTKLRKFFQRAPIDALLATETRALRFARTLCARRERKCQST